MGLGILQKISVRKHKSKSSILTPLKRTGVKSSKLVSETTDVVSTEQKRKRTIIQKIIKKNL